MSTLPNESTLLPTTIVVFAKLICSIAVSIIRISALLPASFTTIFLVVNFYSNFEMIWDLLWVFTGNLCWFVGTVINSLKMISENENVVRRRYSAAQYFFDNQYSYQILQSLNGQNVFVHIKCINLKYCWMFFRVPTQHDVIDMINLLKFVWRSMCNLLRCSHCTNKYIQILSSTYVYFCLNHRCVVANCVTFIFLI